MLHSVQKSRGSQVELGTILGWERVIMTKLVARFAKDESGATAIEYGLIAALISVGLVAILTTVGGDLVAIFTAVSAALQGAIN